MSTKTAAKKPAVKAKAAKPQTSAAKEASAQAGSDARKVIREGDALADDLARQPFDHRPMIWQDIAEFGVRHQRTSADVVYDLALQSKYQYTQMVKKSVVAPVDVELLTRLYDLSPSSCMWKLPNVSDVLQMLYGPVIKQFTPGKSGWDATDFKTAELAVGRRFARLLGRADTATYRWIEGGGKVTRRLANVLGKVVDICAAAPVPHLRFEEVATPILARRGIDIDELAPLPTSMNVRRPPGSIGRRVSVNSDALVGQASYAGGAFN